MSSGPERQRVFFALEPPSDVRRALARAGEQLAWPGRLVAEERLHLTLVFVGDATHTEVDTLVDCGGAVPLPSVDLEIDRGGFFPRAGVGWLGCTEPPGPLLAFRKALFGCLDRVGLHRDRRTWTPHVTVYRHLRKRPVKVRIEALRWPVRGFALLASRQVAGGVRYEPIRRWPAAAPGDLPAEA